MENIQTPDPNTSLFSLTIDAQSSYTLRSTASWARVLGVVSMITAGLCVVLGIIVQQSVSRMGDVGYYGTRSSISASKIGNMGLVAYILMGALYLVSGIFANNAGSNINAALKTNDIQKLNSGFAGARNFFAFWGVLMILFLVLLVISLAGSL